MKENKEYLNEDWYQQVKKKITRLSLTILIIGSVIGASVIAVGVVKVNHAKSENEGLYKSAYKESEKKIKQANERLEQIKVEKESLKSQISKKEYECNSLNMQDPNWFRDVNSCKEEVSNLEEKVTNLEMEAFDLEHDDFAVTYNKIFVSKYYIYYFIGAGIIGMTMIIALSVYIISKRREIHAFTIQQSMPIAQEAIDKMSPTIGKAAGVVGHDIAQGISSGIRDANNQSK